MPIKISIVLSGFLSCLCFAGALACWYDDMVISTEYIGPLKAE
ncbi:hypothetical protein ACFL4X_00560 [Gemmatimonadota bacterium]